MKWRTWCVLTSIPFMREKPRKWGRRTRNPQRQTLVSPTLRILEILQQNHVRTVEEPITPSLSAERGRRSSEIRSKRGGMNENHRSDSRKCYVCENEGHIARDCDERCDKGDRKKGGKKRNHSGDGGNGGKPKWYGSSENFKNRRKSYDDDDDATGFGAMITEIEEIKEKKTPFPVQTLYDDDALMNYAKSDITYSDDHVVIVDSRANRLAINKLSLLSNLDTSKRGKIKTALKKSIIDVKGVGNIVPLTNVYFFPDSSENLCGVNVIDKMEFSCLLDDHLTVFLTEKLIFN
jgi:hypothetical protein